MNRAHRRQVGNRGRYGPSTANVDFFARLGLEQDQMTGEVLLPGEPMIFTKPGCESRGHRDGIDMVMSLLLDGERWTEERPMPCGCTVRIGTMDECD